MSISRPVYGPRWLFVSRPQFIVLHVLLSLAALWYLCVLGISLVRFLTDLGFSTGSLEGPARATSLSFGYAAGTASLQVLVGAVLAVGISLFPKRPRLLLCALAFIPYCLQPYVIAEIWRQKNVLNFGTEDFFDLVSASVWQYSPFPMLFFVIAFEGARAQRRLTETESASALARFLQLNASKMLSLGATLIGLRFLWMYSKFDLPYLFPPRITDQNQLLVVEVFERSGHGDGSIYLGALIVSLLLILIVSKALVSAIKRLDLWDRFVKQFISRGLLALTDARGSSGARRLFLLRISTVFLLFIFLFPLLKAITVYYQHFPRALVEMLTSDTLLRPLKHTVLLCGAAAASASVVGTMLAYAVNRVDAGLTRRSLKIVFPYVSYALPLVVFAGYAGWIREFLQTCLLEIGTPLEHVSKLSYDLAVVLIYTSFCLPFVFFILTEYVGSERSKSVEIARLADGLSPGFRFQAKLVLSRHFVPLIYAAYFAFVICWQDIALPTRLDYSLLASEFHRLTRDVGQVQPEVVTAAGLLLGIGVAFGYLVVAVKSFEDEE